MEIKKVVVSKEGVRLDEIVFQEYGHLKYFEEILQKNIKVFLDRVWKGAWSKEKWIETNCSVFLPLGSTVELFVEEKCQKTEEVEASKLW